MAITKVKRSAARQEEIKSMKADPAVTRLEAAKTEIGSRIAEFTALQKDVLDTALIKAAALTNQAAIGSAATELKAQSDQVQLVIDLLNGALSALAGFASLSEDDYNVRKVNLTSGIESLLVNNFAAVVQGLVGTIDSAAEVERLAAQEVIDAGLRLDAAKVAVENEINKYKEVQNKITAALAVILKDPAAVQATIDGLNIANKDVESVLGFLNDEKVALGVATLTGLTAQEADDAQTKLKDGVDAIVSVNFATDVQGYVAAIDAAVQAEAVEAGLAAGRLDAAKEAVENEINKYIEVQNKITAALAVTLKNPAAVKATIDGLNIANKDVESVLTFLGAEKVALGVATLIGLTAQEANDAQTKLKDGVDAIVSVNFATDVQGFADAIDAAGAAEVATVRADAIKVLEARIDQYTEILNDKIVNALTDADNLSDKAAVQSDVESLEAKKISVESIITALKDAKNELDAATGLKITDYASKEAALDREIEGLRGTDFDKLIGESFSNIMDAVIAEETVADAGRLKDAKEAVQNEITKYNEVQKKITAALAVTLKDPAAVQATIDGLKHAETIVESVLGSLDWRMDLLEGKQGMAADEADAEKKELEESILYNLDVTNVSLFIDNVQSFVNAINAAVAVEAEAVAAAERLSDAKAEVEYGIKKYNEALDTIEKALTDAKSATDTTAVQSAVDSLGDQKAKVESILSLLDGAKVKLGKVDGLTEGEYENGKDLLGAEISKIEGTDFDGTVTGLVAEINGYMPVSVDPMMVLLDGIDTCNGEIGLLNSRDALIYKDFTNHYEGLKTAVLARDSTLVPNDLVNKYADECKVMKVECADAWSGAAVDPATSAICSVKESCDCEVLHNVWEWFATI